MTHIKTARAHHMTPHKHTVKGGMQMPHNSHGIRGYGNKGNQKRDFTYTGSRHLYSSGSKH